MFLKFCLCCFTKTFLTLSCSNLRLPFIIYNPLLRMTAISIEARVVSMWCCVLSCLLCCLHALSMLWSTKDPEDEVPKSSKNLVKWGSVSCQQQQVLSISSNKAWRSVQSFSLVSSNLGTRFLLSGVELSHPKISNFGLCIENTN